MALAESRAESGELRDQHAAITALLQQRKCGTAPYVGSIAGTVLAIKSRQLVDVSEDAQM
jgi:hypothetical protein